MIVDPADRLGALKEYYFSMKLKEVAQLRATGQPILNMGIGSPDLMPDQTVISELIEQVIAPRNHGYQPYQGVAALREAIAAFSAQVYHIDVSQQEVLPLIGSKEGITHISMAYLNPGDQVLIPALGYPTYQSVTRMVGAEPVFYPLIAERNWEPDWDFLEKVDYSKVKLLWLNYPHMPTGTVGSGEIMEKFVGLAHRKRVLLCHDNPYSLIQKSEPLSVFSVDGAKEVALELNSFSKTFNMAGWRVGWLSGAEKLLKPVVTIKSNMDSGMFKPVQLAAVKALKLGQPWYDQVRGVYQERRTLVEELMRKLGCQVSDGQAGMFVWGKVPSGTGEQLCDHLLYDKEIFVAPGHIFGDAGKDYIRISLCVDKETIKEAIERLE